MEIKNGKTRNKTTKKGFICIINRSGSCRIVLFYAGPGDWSQRCRVKAFCSLPGLCSTSSIGSDDNFYILFIQKMKE
jgi:hypothetical protein